MKQHLKLSWVPSKDLPVVSALVVAVVAMVLFFLPSTPKMTVSEIPGMDAADFYADSTFRDNRQMGLVSLDKFVELANGLGSGIFNADENIIIGKDSVTFMLSNTNKSDYLFSDFTNVGQLDRLHTLYKEFPVRIINNGTGFVAEVTEIDNHRYIKIPYLTLTSLAKYVYGKSSKGFGTNQDETEIPTITPENNSILFNMKLDNKKIQTEGLVLQNFSDIQAARNKKKTSDPVDQLRIAWVYVNEHWLYINDPTTDNGRDTWRNATETITNYYSSGRTYTGDCDDYAILMASFARQCGLESRLVCALKGDKGHMYAEFQRKGECKTCWHNLDWGMEFDSKERYGSVEKIFNDL